MSAETPQAEHRHWPVLGRDFLPRIAEILGIPAGNLGAVTVHIPFDDFVQVDIMFLASEGQAEQLADVMRAEQAELTEAMST